MMPLKTEKTCTIVAPKVKFEKLTFVNDGVGYKGKFWQNGSELKVDFIKGSQRQIDFVEANAKEWEKHANIKFNFGRGRLDSDIRVAFIKNGRAYSHLGTNATFIDLGEETMNFSWLDRPTVLHEFGHALGLGHGQLNPKNPIKWDYEAVYEYYAGAPNYWTKEDTDWNVLRLLEDDGSLLLTNRDPKSIMHYPVSKNHTLDGEWVGFNEDLSPTDISFIGSIYPKDSLTLKQFLGKLYYEDSRVRRRPNIAQLKVLAKGLGISSKSLNKRGLVHAIETELAKVR